MDPELEECLRCDVVFPAGSHAVEPGTGDWHGATVCRNKAECDKTLLTRAYDTLDRLRFLLVSSPEVDRDLVAKLATGISDDLLELLDGDWEPVKSPRCEACYTPLPAGSADNTLCEFCTRQSAQPHYGPLPRTDAAHTIFLGDFWAKGNLFDLWHVPAARPWPQLVARYGVGNYDEMTERALFYAVHGEHTTLPNWCDGANLALDEADRRVKAGLKASQE